MRGTTLALGLFLAGCAHNPAAVSSDPRAAFMARLQSLCGKAFAGRLVSTEAADAEMADMPMVMHVRTCSSSEIRIPFHVGRKDGSWDRSRTWVISRTDAGLRLKHDHRHEDGTSDKVTMYGGDTAGLGTIGRQEFVVDAESIAMFRREGLAKSITNIWAVEVEETTSRAFTYQLRRSGENARFFRVAFDLSKPVAAPPAPWGAD